MTFLEPRIRLRKLRAAMRELREASLHYNDNRDGTDDSQREAYTAAEEIRAAVVKIRREAALIFDEANWRGAGDKLKPIIKKRSF